MLNSLRKRFQRKPSTFRSSSTTPNDGGSDLLNPLNPLSPLNPMNQVDTYSPSSSYGGGLSSSYDSCSSSNDAGSGDCGGGDGGGGGD